MTKTTQWILLTVIVLVGCASGEEVGAPQAERPPNVVLIVAAGVPPEKYEWFGGHAMGRARLEDVEGRLSNRRIAGAMVHSMDVGIGRILDALDEAGVADETLVWFFWM